MKPRDLSCQADSAVRAARAATRWRDSVCGTHVEYDQRPDVFRCAPLPPYSVYFSVFTISVDQQPSVFPDATPTLILPFRRYHC